MGWKKGIGRRRGRRVVSASGPGGPRRFSVGQGSGGREFAVVNPVDLECPFCGLNVVVADDPPSVMHAVPMCRKFEDEEPLVFLRNARLIIAGKLPDDDEWPISVSENGDKKN